MLIRYRLRNGQVLQVTSWEMQSGDSADLNSAQLSGVVELHEPRHDTIVQFGSRWVERLWIDGAASEIRVELKVDAPVPEYPTDHTLASPWPIQIRYTSAQRRWALAALIPWLIPVAGDDKCSGNCDEWLERSNTSRLKLRRDFPFHALGLANAELTGFGYMRVGLFVATNNKRSTLLIACLTTTDQNTSVAGQLSITHFSKVQIGFSNSSMRAALVAHLDAGLEGSDGAGSPWLSLFEWPAEKGLGPDRLLDLIWNRTARSSAIGLRGARSGRPWWPMPIFGGVKWAKKGRWQRLVFATPTRKGEPPLLRKLTYGRIEEGGDPSVDVRFAWYATESNPVDSRFSAEPPRAIKLSGRIELQPDPPPPSAQEPAAGRSAAKLIDDVLYDGKARSIFSCNVVVNEYAAASAAWLNFGSIDIHPRKLAAKERIQLECDLVGEWDAAVCDVYTQIELRGLPCKFRMSNSGDALPQTIVAQFDVANRLEDELQRPALPIVASYERKGDSLIDGALAGTLNMRVHAEPGRDSITQLQLRRGTFSAMDGKALYLQTRPYNFARLWPANFDEEAGLDFSYWRSDDPEGAQWRVPDATIEFDLPPQTVAEEMERGTRFWPIDEKTGQPAAYIDPMHPLRYRFSPPTRVKVRPSRVERRYNRNTNNLSDILEGARVEAFRTELLYPISLDFEADSNGEPAIHIAESGSFLGRPTPNLPLRQEDRGDDEHAASRSLAEDIFPADLAEWFAQAVAPGADLNEFQRQYNELRWHHSANRAQFMARIAQFHLHDPLLPGRQLMLSTGLKAQLRRPVPNQQSGKAPKGSMPPLLNPLPTGVEIDSKLKETHLKDFLGENLSWGDPERDGALRAGALHTMEFPSELVAVLREPGAVGAFIETLSFSTLGASGASAVTFDEGRTTFSVEISDGQVWRIRKIRLGRVALLWNKAKHVVVYERSVVPSLQFEPQQPNERTFGWPILRKTEEYVEPIEMFRVFSDEPDPEANSTGFMNGSEFITPRIYVDGAWGRDLRHGYKIPLWNPADSSGFYPKPLAALSGHASGGEFSRQWQENPDELYFYSNTQKGKGADSNKWEAFLGLDQTEDGQARTPIVTNIGLKSAQVLDSVRLPSPRMMGMRRKGFDLVVRSDGPVNLQYGRGDTEMLAAGLDVVSLARTTATSPVTPGPDSPVGKALHNVKVLNDYSGRIDSLRDEAQAFVRELPELFLRYQLAGCDTLMREMRARADELFKRLDQAAAGAFAKIPDFDAKEYKTALEADAEALVTRLRDEMFDWTLPPLESFRTVAEEFRKQLQLADEYSKDELKELITQVGARLHVTFGLCDQVIAIAEKKLKEALLAPTAAAKNHVDTVVKGVTEFSAQVAAWLTSSGDEFRDKAEGIRKSADELRARLGAINIPHLAPVLKGVISALQAASQVAREGTDVVDDKIQTFKNYVKAGTDGVTSALGNLTTALMLIETKITQAELDTAFTPLNALREKIQKQLLPEVWADVDKAYAAIDELLALSGSAVNGASALLENSYAKWRKNLEAITRLLAQELGAALHGLTLPVVTLCGKLRQATQEIKKFVSTEINEQRNVVSKLIDALGVECQHGQAALDKLRGAIETECRRLAEVVETRVTALATSLLDEATLQRVSSWKKELAAYQDIPGKGLKLVKAIGSLPELPNLKFNADRVEYLFDDLKKQIETSPFAARLREIDSGLKELGLAVPVRELLDQLVPDNLEVDFNKVFRDMGGIDFRKLFAKFKIPGLDKDHIKITHGIDKPTRTAWVKAQVSTSYMQPQELFAAGPLVVRTAAMSLRAQTDVRVALDGRRKVETTGLLRADWSLEFKGAKLVAFRDVTVTMDGGRFHFNISPDNVELHPSLKFISEIGKKLGERIPPCIELVRDSRGVISGARANLSTIIKKPPSLGVVKIGPLTLIGGLALTLEEGCRFAVSAHMSVGTKSAPIFVQINFLGGGMWLEAEARFVNGDITYVGNVGLALGSTESFNIGGVARGSYSLLVFAYASFKSGAGGSLRAGLSIQGSARILGIVNAYVLLLLEVIHGEGKPRGQGLLDVEIEIGRWYSINIHKQVERSL